MSSIIYRNVEKRYNDGTKAVTDLNLEIAEGEFLVVVGPSGCGKTTALRMAAGLEDISGGELIIGDKVVNNLAPRERDIAMVFQNYALYPHMTVFENIAFPLENQQIGKDEIKKQVYAVAEILGLTEHLRRRPGNLSGGQRQRVAMGRAIVRKPKAFLMDEPLSNLDAKLRIQMRSEITRLQRELKVTTLYVTHDQVEAMTMGDRIAMLRKGVLQQVGVPLELYQKPANLFVAAFIGSPAMNLLTVQVSVDANGVVLKTGDQLLRPSREIAETYGLARYNDQRVVLGFRPESLRLLNQSSPAAMRIRATTVLSEMQPPEQIVQLTTNAEPVVENATIEASDGDMAAPPVLQASKGTVSATLVARVANVDPIPLHVTSEWGIEVEHVHFFDGKTGASISP